MKNRLITFCLNLEGLSQPISHYMKLKALLLFVYTSHLVAHGQVTLTASDMNTDVGLQFNRGFSDFYAPGDAGENAVWDFSGIIPLAFIELETIPVVDGIQPELFPNPTLAFSFSGTDGTEYYELNENEMIYLGDIGEVDYQNVYSDGEQIIAFPASIGVSFTDDVLSNLIQPGVSSVFEGTTEVTVDGSGTLIMPWGTITNALRTSVSYNVTETIEINGGETLVNQISRQSNFWYASGYPGPIIGMALSEILFDGETEPVFSEASTYISEIALSTEQAGLDSKIILFPNPAQKNLSISLNEYGIIVESVTLVDLSGKIVKNLSGSSVNGYREFLHLDVSDLERGVYIVNLETNGPMLQTKVVIE